MIDIVKEDKQNAWSFKLNVGNLAARQELRNQQLNLLKSEHMSELAESHRPNYTRQVHNRDRRSRQCIPLPPRISMVLK